MKEPLFIIEGFTKKLRKDRVKQFGSGGITGSGGNQKQQNVAVVERVNVLAENFLSKRMSGTQTAFSEDSVNAINAEIQFGVHRNHQQPVREIEEIQ